MTDDKLYSGKHWMRLDGDILFSKYVGMITARDVQEFMHTLDKVLVPSQTYYIIADVAEVTGMEAAARKIATEWFARYDIGGTVNFGAGPMTRALGALISSLLRLLHRNNMSTHFAKTEEEARAWTQQQRQRRAAKIPPT